MQERHSDRKKYFQEQIYTTKKYVIPFITKKKQIKNKARILEIGCGEGGNLVPFAELGLNCTGVDLSQNKINLANELMPEEFLNKNVHFKCEDIYEFVKTNRNSFDFIMLRDVIEHIPDHEKLFTVVKELLTEDGIAFFGFPPWQNPFGGHQQMFANPLLSKLPYVHLLPKNIYQKIMRISGESEIKQTGMLELIETRTTIESFERDLLRAGLYIRLRKHFFINPNYEIKFDLKPIKQLELIAMIPYFRNFLTTASYYLLKK